ncbi:adhesion G-protein coupled receptor G7 [Sphaerodactylus townsendi]|uniref:adhesion G-protein coupled receptor G7 n=1 Tax=Sphaerodactylus townsendi TaxID=933632 RepID=UPI0020271F28|nr:adhesion G-protein coupled receptor G7 [Sphaerodactylus townsendi]
MKGHLIVSQIYKLSQVNFCDKSTFVDNASQYHLTFEKIIVGKHGYSMEKCDNGTVNGGAPKATRMCTRKNGVLVLELPSVLNCNVTLVGLSEKIQSVNETAPAEIVHIATDTQILTSRPEQLNSTDISMAASIAEKILNLSNSNVPGEAMVAAVTTVSQLLDANKTEFSLSNNNLTSAVTSLTMAMQNFSVSNTSTLEVVQSNIAVRKVSPQEPSATILFSAMKGSTDSLVSDRIKVDEQATGLKTDDRTEIQLFINITSTNFTGTERVGFVLYQNDRLFPSKIYKTQLEENYSNQIISSNVNGTMVNNVKIALNPHVSFFKSSTLHSSKAWKAKSQGSILLTCFFLIPNLQYNRSEFRLYNYACVFWNYSLNDWDTAGCIKEADSSKLLRCSCNHTTNFAILMSFRINYKYARPLEILSYIGCGLSIAGLTCTIVFLILIRKQRRTSITLMVLSLCSAMLIFNIIFISGIENTNASKNADENSAANAMLQSDKEGPPANDWCTAVAALLHYFLLATFMWTGLNAVQVYLLLIEAKRHLFRHYIAIMSLTGWGVPALFVSITLGATYSNSNYRQEEFCWLAALDSHQNFSIEKPLLWAFLLPVAFILLFNIIVFGRTVICVIWKENKNLTSTKKKSIIKNILATLSIAITLGITWIVGYLMLIDHEKTNIVFSYVFCIFSATQGLQIFVFQVLTTTIFRKKVTHLFEAYQNSKIGRTLNSRSYFFSSILGKMNPTESFKTIDSTTQFDELLLESSSEV